MKLALYRYIIIIIIIIIIIQWHLSDTNMIQGIKILLQNQKYLKTEKWTNESHVHRHNRLKVMELTTGN